MKETYKKFAKYYDLYTKEFVDDLALYLDFCNSNDRILEIGCGSGRVLEHFLNNGFDIDGIDISEEMLELAGAKLQRFTKKSNFKLYNHDFSEKPFNKKYSKVLITFYTFNYILGNENQLRFLKNVYQSMNMGSEIILDLFYPYTKMLPEYENKWIGKQIQCENSEIRLLDKRSLDGNIETRIQKYISNKSTEEIITKREFINKQDMLNLLFEAGFKNILLSDGYKNFKFYKIRECEQTTGNYLIKGKK